MSDDAKHLELLARLFERSDEELVAEERYRLSPKTERVLEARRTRAYAQIGAIDSRHRYAIIRDESESRNGGQPHCDGFIKLTHEDLPSLYGAIAFLLGHRDTAEALRDILAELDRDKASPCPANAG